MNHLLLTLNILDNISFPNYVDFISVFRVILPELKRILMIFGLERKGIKSELVERVLEFLLNPFDKGISIPTRKSKKDKKVSFC